MWGPGVWGSRGVEGLVVKGMWSAVLQHCLLAYPLADLGGAPARAPVGPKIFSISYIFFLKIHRNCMLVHPM